MSGTQIFNPNACHEGESEFAGSFLELQDTPDTYTGQSGRAVTVNANGSGLTFNDFPEPVDENINFFKIPSDKAYTIKGTQDMVASGSIRLGGSLRLDGKLHLVKYRSQLDSANLGVARGSVRQSFIDIEWFDAITHYQFNVTHNFNEHPIVVCIDASGQVFRPVVKYVNTYQIQLKSNSNIQGARILLIRSRNLTSYQQKQHLVWQQFGSEFRMMLNHDLGRMPLVQVLDNEGNTLEVAVRRVNDFAVMLRSNIQHEGQVLML